MKRSSVLLSTFFCVLFSTYAQATWVSVFVYRHFSHDHVHINVANDCDFDDGTQLNIMRNEAFASVSTYSEYTRASKLVTFHHSMPKERILDAWAEYFDDNKESFNLVRNNCATASTYILNDVLGMNLVEGRHVSPALFSLPMVTSNHHVHLPDNVRKMLIETLNRDGIPYYTEKTIGDPSTFYPEL